MEKQLTYIDFSVRVLIKYRDAEMTGVKITGALTPEDGQTLSDLFIGWKEFMKEFKRKGRWFEDSLEEELEEPKTEEEALEVDKID